MSRQAGISVPLSRRTSTTAPTSGLLTGAGCDPMCATVLIAAVPRQAPVELSTLTRPVRDKDGRLADWDLRVTTTGPTASVIGQFEAFRRTYAVDFPLGERAFLNSLVAEADVLGYGNDALAQLRLSEASFDAEAAGQLPGLLEGFERRCAARNVMGWGVVRSGEVRLVRRLVATDPPTTLLATPTAAVAVGHSGLRLMMRHRTITGWRETPDAMLLITPTATVRIGRASLSAEMLKTIAEGTGSASLRSLPLVALAAPVLGPLRAAVSLATQTDSGLDVRALPVGRAACPLRTGSRVSRQASNDAAVSGAEKAPGARRAR